MGKRRSKGPSTVPWGTPESTAQVDRCVPSRITCCDAMLLDFSKAFDKVPHNRLLLKRDHYGIRGNTLQLIRHFLTDRTQQVLLEGTHSSTCAVDSVAPQGTVLGLLLFLAFINDLPDSVTSNARLFADDCLLFATSSTWLCSK
jgi:methylaspartate ammonia-lyase